MSNCKFSVVIPSHNRPEFLKRALIALEGQTISPTAFEVIVILSPDDSSFSWLNRFSTKLNLRYLSPMEDRWEGKNVSFKRNFGARLASSDWVAFTDDDCSPSEKWLESALRHLNSEEIYGIEGPTKVPQDSPKTLTWKGLLRLQNSGGYQTCNIFYRKKVFIETAGFDSENFKWFMEDTDLALTVKGLGKKIVFEPGCVVFHPVGPRASWRILHEAKYYGLKIHLFRKHRALFEKEGIKTLRIQHYVYLAIYALLFYSMINLDVWLFCIVTISFLCLVGIHMAKTFSGIKKNPVEIFEVAWRMSLFPLIAFYSLVKEIFKLRIPPKKAFQLLSPF